MANKLIPHSSNNNNDSLPAISNTDPNVPSDHDSMRDRNSDMIDNSHNKGNADVNNKLRQSTRQRKLPPKYADHGMN